MTTMETRREGYQISFAEVFLGTLNWGYVNTKTPLSQFLQFVQDSPIECMETHKTIRQSIDIRLPLQTGSKYMPDRFTTVVTDAGDPEIKDNQIIYSPKTYSAWVTRTPRPNGSYAYTVALSTILRGRYNHLETSLRGVKTPLIIFVPRPNKKQAQNERVEEPLQAAFIPMLMPQAS